MFYASDRTGNLLPVSKTNSCVDNRLPTLALLYRLRRCCDDGGCLEQRAHGARAAASNPSVCTPSSSAVPLQVPTVEKPVHAVSTHSTSSRQVPLTSKRCLAARREEVGNKNGALLFWAVYFDLVHLSEFLAVIGLLDRIQAGFVLSGILGTASVYLVASPAHLGARAITLVLQDSAARWVRLRSHCS